MQALLFEIGSEEIPAGYIQPALDAMASSLARRLDESRIAHGAARTYGTPRRLAVLVEDVAGRQETVSELVTGPPVKVAFDADGNPAVPAQKFAEKVGLPVSELSTTTTARGEYLCATVTDEGGATTDVLARILPEIIGKIPFPKSMRWADLPGTFARPVHTLVALLGQTPVAFTWNGVQSGNQTKGHFFMCPYEVELAAPEQYLERLEAASVIADVERRRGMIAEQVDEAAKAAGGKVLDDPGLLDIVTNIVEYPVATSGAFDREFLEVPRPVLITAMREHQKYFSVVDDAGELLPAFVAVNNTRPRDPGLVARGHERVLRARLSDARFFFEADRQRSMDEWVTETGGILFQARLGTMLEKTQRARALAEFMADRLVEAVGLDPENRQWISRAATLCKADLVSEVVGEFPNLQGAMGRIYAELGNEPAEVCAAIEEHYRPTHAGGELPTSAAGAILAVADKMDSLCACFSVGLVPTGSMDPYALRRAAIGAISILLDRDWPLPVSGIVEKSLELVGGKATRDAEETRQKVMDFLGDRMAALLVEQGNPRDVVNAACAVSVDPVPHLWRRVRALAELTRQQDYDALAIAFKRVANIIRQAEEKLGDQPRPTEVDPALFEQECESALWDAYGKMAGEVEGLLAKGEVEKALLTVAGLRPLVDAFFDGVMVMAKEEDLRNNRLALLGAIAAVFARFADFTKIATPKE